jgi:diketogulonate reductase-like aldo/keto reductase
MQSLGPRYRSVEEHRLDQSDRYEVHWKRWGPYVSERQWVSLASAVVTGGARHSGADRREGYCPRRLLRQR